MPAFAAPWLLAGLLALPLLWWLIRRLPPPPRVVRLPTVLLLGAQAVRPSAARRPPWWLAALRLGAVALVLIGLAGPEWRREAPAEAPPRRVALVIDNGWAAAPAWPRLRDAAAQLLAELPDAAEVALIPTALPPTGERAPVRLQSAEVARATLDLLSPEPWPGDRARAARDVPEGSALYWVADGIETGDAAMLRRLGGTVQVAGAPFAAIVGAEVSADAWAVQIAGRRGDEPLAVVARDGDGRVLGRADVPPDARDIMLGLPLDARPVRFDLEPSSGAAGSFLVAPGLARPRALIIDGEAAEGAPPLLRGATYVRRALEPFTRLTSGSPADAAGADLILLIDTALEPGPSADAVLGRVRAGGIAISFAGPRLAARGSALSPVPLDGGARALGSVLSWETPQTIGSFARGSPLAGLPDFSDAVVRKQLVGGDAPGVMRWAVLADGTPLVSARREGRGLLVLVHTAAGPEWSTLPLSGALQAILQRILPLTSNPQALDIAGTAPFQLSAVLGADGALLSPPLARRLDQRQFAAAIPSPSAPPGLWRSGDLARPLNLGGTVISGEEALRPLATNGLRVALAASPPLRFGPPLIALGLLLAVLDALVSGHLRDRPFRLRRLAPAAAAALALLVVLPAKAQAFLPGFAPDIAQSRVALGVIASGNPAADAAARSGLGELGRTLTQRTSVGTEPPRAVDPAASGLGLYPVLYWRPVRPLAPAAAARLRDWLRQGGILLVDPPAGQDPATLRDALGPLDPPPLELLTPAHVLTRTFYRLTASPAGIAPGPVWIDAGTKGGEGRIARVVIASADWPARWSSPDHAVRESALRFGVNLMLYALTGDYKADPVHGAAQPPS